MFGRIGKSWFNSCAKYTRRENENRNKWLSEIPSSQREKILEELDVNKVLSYLVYKRVFSLEEYKDIWSQESYRKRTEYFLDKLSLKGPSAFSAFCSILEEVCPNLLTCFLLGYEDCVHRHFPALSEQTKLRGVSEMEPHETCEMSDQEGSPSAEEHLNQSFNKHRQRASITTQCQIQEYLTGVITFTLHELRDDSLLTWKHFVYTFSYSDDKIKCRVVLNLDTKVQIK